MDPRPSMQSDEPTSSTTTRRRSAQGKYQMVRLIGRGSSSKVYQAISIEDNNREVAIKMINKALTDPSTESRIFQEAELIQRLNYHPNVLRILEVGATEKYVYLVTELAKGGDLYRKLASCPNGRFSEPVARSCFKQLISGLYFCHQNGVVHRNLKLHNILLDEDGNVKISNFGLIATTRSSPAYSAPEVMRTSQTRYDMINADVWSCGVVLYVMLTGFLPFDESDSEGMYMKMMKRAYRFPSWVSKPARVLIYRLLDPNPDTRIGIAVLAQKTESQIPGSTMPLGG